mmetsp:Transcript_41110/g.94799  ORF Transcript_41110/g.94799 Transcript_41110/m.94799 type:complete len:294 (-) Transcript_41110:894-1775(-)
MDMKSAANPLPNIPFPRKLYDLIDSEPDRLICWSTHGASFMIVDVVRAIPRGLPEPTMPTAPARATQPDVGYRCLLGRPPSEPAPAPDPLAVRALRPDPPPAHSTGRLLPDRVTEVLPAHEAHLFPAPAQPLRFPANHQGPRQWGVLPRALQPRCSGQDRVHQTHGEEGRETKQRRRRPPRRLLRKAHDVAVPVPGNPGRARVWQQPEHTEWLPRLGQVAGAYPPLRARLRPRARLRGGARLRAGARLRTGAELPAAAAAAATAAAPVDPGPAPPPQRLVRLRRLAPERQEDE